MYKVLLVDDEPIARIAVSNMLDWKKLDCDLAGTAGNGAEALEFMQTHPVDILITDLIMPQVDGLELIRRLTQQNFGGSILVLSNYSDFQLVREALLNGAQDYILKAQLETGALETRLLQCIGRLRKQNPETPVPEHVNHFSTAQVQHYREAILAAYLLGQGLQEEMTSSVQELLDKPPYWLFNIFLQKRSGKGIPEKSLRSVLKSIFEDTPQLDILHLSDCEYLCLVPCRTLCERQCTRETKSIQIIRQLKIYFNQDVCVLDADAFESSESVYAGYSHCVRMQQILFYEPYSRRFDAANTHLAPFTTDLAARFSGNLLASEFLAGGTTRLEQAVCSFLDECEKRLVHPAEIRMHTADTLRLLRTGQAPADSTERPESKIRSCTTSAELKETLFQLLPQFLAYEGAAAEYKQEVRQALLYIHAHYTEKFTLCDVSQAVSLDKSYLCRLFKKETGTSIFQFINQLRLEKAAGLIASSQMNINEIALAVGVPDALYFTRMFKKHFGVSPSEYRKSFASSPENVRSFQG